jgi:signal transduction histidine kinase
VGIDRSDDDARADGSTALDTHVQSERSHAEAAQGMPAGSEVKDRASQERELGPALQLYADIAHHVQIGLSVWKLVPPPEAGLLLVAFNPAAERTLDTNLAACVGEGLDQILPGLASSELADMLQCVAADGRPRELAAFRFIKPNALRRTLLLKAFPLPDARVGLAIEDVSQQTRSLELQVAERRVLEQLAAGKPLGDVLRELILSIELHVPHTLGSILRLDAETGRVHVLAAPHLPEAFNRVVEGEPIGPAAGSCGTAAYIKKPVYSTDIATDPLWLRYREAALSHGLRACWSTPILSSEGHVLGTFALYYRDTRRPRREELELIARVTHVASIAMERRQLDDRLRALTGRIEAVREEERTHMAREIHDMLGQSLTVLKMDVAWLNRRPRGTASRDAVLDGRLSAMSKLIDDVINQVRRIAAQLRPGVLDDLGLAAAVEWQARDFSQRSGLDCAFECNIPDARFEREVSTAIFRILQETLTNVARHAHAQRVEVSLTEDEGHLRLRVRDDGAGMSPDATARRRSLGLLGMHERAQRLGGQLSVTSTPGAGTVVLVDVPLRAGVAE